MCLCVYLLSVLSARSLSSSVHVFTDSLCESCTGPVILHTHIHTHTSQTDTHTSIPKLKLRCTVIRLTHSHAHNEMYTYIKCILASCTLPDTHNSPTSTHTHSMIDPQSKKEGHPVRGQPVSYISMETRWHSNKLSSSCEEGETERQT